MKTSKEYLNEESIEKGYDNLEHYLDCRDLHFMIDEITEWTEEYAKQKAIEFAKHLGARNLEYCIETGEWHNGFTGDTTEHEYESFMIIKEEQK
jgi:hypothetical protein